jgi:hypothetical protein
MRTICCVNASAITSWRTLVIRPIVVVFLLCPSWIFAQDQSLQSLKTVGYQDALKAFAQPVLDSCGSWPPQFVDKKDASNPKAKVAKPDASADLLAALATASGVDTNVTAKEYDGLFLRLFDSVNTFNVGTANTNLFGFISGAKDSADALSALWGTSMFEAKYDCLALLNASARRVRPELPLRQAFEDIYPREVLRAATGRANQNSINPYAEAI